MRFSSGQLGLTISLLTAFSVTALLSSCDPNATIRVTSSADGGPGSLRAAIDAANRDDQTTAVIIELPSGTYELSRCGADDSNAAGDLDIKTKLPITISAKGAVTIRQTCAGERVLEGFGTGRLTLTGVTVTGGQFVGTDPAVIARGGAVRTTGDLKLQDASVVSNSVTGAPGSTVPARPADSGIAQGGGVYAGGAFEAVNSRVMNNSATGGQAPASSTPKPAAGGAAEGGGVYVVGKVSVTGGEITENTATGGNGALGGGVAASGAFARGGGIAQALSPASEATVEAATLSRNIARGGGNARTELPGQGCVEVAYSRDAEGGALAGAGAVTLRNVRASRNFALGGAGTSGFECANGFANEGGARGGAVAAPATLLVEQGEFSDNEALGMMMGGGAVYGRGDVTITGGTFLRNRTSTGDGGAVYAENDALIQQSTLKNNRATVGGGIHAKTLRITDSTLEANEASNGTGGGAYATELIVRGARVLGNEATAGGGGLFASVRASVERSVIEDNATTRNGGGGGIRSEGPLRVATTRFARNKATIFLPDPLRPWLSIAAPGPGSAVYAVEVEATAISVADHALTGTPMQTPTVIRATRASFVNSTVTGNYGAISADDLSLTNCTIVDGQGSALQAQRLTSQGTAVAVGGSFPVCDAPPVSTGSYNWFEDASCALSGAENHQEGADFLLGGLSDNGGDVLTRAPAHDSVLVNRIPQAVCPVLVDARGTPRPQAGACDIGAVELSPQAGVGPTDLAIRFNSSPPSVVPGTEATWRLLVENHGTGGAAPTVQLQIPSALKVITARIEAGPNCALTASPYTCTFTSSIPPGGSQAIVITGQVDPALTTELALSASVLAANLQPPLTDDVARATTLVTPKNELVAITRSYVSRDGASWTVESEVTTLNRGPSAALGTESQPIQTVVIPAPGVTKYWDIAPYVGSLSPSAIYGSGVGGRIILTGTGTPPAELGVLEVRGGLYASPSTTRTPLTNADIEFQVDNVPYSMWEPAQATLHVTNSGPGHAGSLVLNVAIVDPQYSPVPGSYHFVVSAGSVQPSPWATASGYTWHIPRLAVGQTVTLRAELMPGRLIDSQWPARLALGVAYSQSVDFSSANNELLLPLNEPR